MPNMTLTKTPMPEQAPDVRNKNFKEVSLGYTEEMAVEEAGRCLHCKNPKCVEGCPVNIRIPEFIAKVSERDFLGAYEVITSTNALPALSGRVCPQESQCESKCVRGVKGEPVAIGRLERFVADWYRENVNKMPEKPESNGIKVAVVGSGPSGLTCASELAKKGYEVSIFEALHTAGGVLVYGIPEFRLPKAIVANEVKKLEAMGVHVMTDMVIGKVLSIDELLEEMGFKAVFVGSGAGLPMFMHIEGEALKGVMSANEYLTRINLMKGYRDESDTPVIRSNAVAVVGGGNVAMDAARCAKRLGAEHVYIVYRRGEAEMPARLEELHHAKEEGIELHVLCNPTKILDDGNGRVGVGMGKSQEVPIAIKKGVEDAKKNMFTVPVTAEGSVPHEIMGEYGAGRVLIKPAVPGTGVLAGGPVRAIMELAGVQNVITKSLGTDNAMNIVKAAAEGLKNMESPVQVAERRGISVAEMFGGKEN